MAKALLIMVFVVGAIFIFGYFVLMQAEKLKPVSPLPPDNTSEEVSPWNIELQSSADWGQYLTDSKGLSLYFFSKDIDGLSHCTDTCLKNWTAFYAPQIKVSVALDSGDFGQIIRSDGQKQTTFHGWPLYYYIGDKKPGDDKGEGLNNIWYLAKPNYSVMIGAIADKLFLTNNLGHALYIFTQDKDNVSKCDDACATKWPRFYVAEPYNLPSTLQSMSLATIDIKNKQTAFSDQPLYYFADDQMRGQTLGDKVGNKWFLLNPFSTSSTPN